MRTQTSAVVALVLAVALAWLPGDVRAVSHRVGTITTVAGTGVAGRSGDGGPATEAEIGHPRGIAALPGGGFLFAEPFNNTVRLVRADGTITTVAGTGSAGFSGDGGPAVAAELDFVHGVALLPDGGYVLADMLNNRIRRVAPNGTITTVAGTGVAGYSGDGGPAGQAELSLPRGIAALPTGELLIPDSGNNRIRLVGLDGRIRTVAGTGVAGSAGDGGPATTAELDGPFGVSPVADGGFLVVERRGNRVRRVWPDGTITTVAGTGVAGYSGDGGPAVAARLNEPHAVAALPDGGFLIADTGNHRIRRVDARGVITTAAGTGAVGFGGDGGSASEAVLFEPKAIAVLANQRGYLIGDAANNRVRLVSIDLRAPLTARLLARAYRARSQEPVTIRFAVNRSARVVLLVRRRGRVVAQATTSAEAGRGAVVLRARLKIGLYDLRLVARAADGRTAGDRASLRIVSP